MFSDRWKQTSGIAARKDFVVGTEIALEVGGVTLDWSKNSRGNDHGALFQEKDRKPVRSTQIDYDYFAEHDEDPTTMEMALSRRLRDVLPRLELLGFTLDRARIEYERCAEESLEESLSLAEERDEPVADSMNFEEFRTFVTLHEIQSLDGTFISSSDSASRERIVGRFAESATNLPGGLPYDSYSERSHFGSLISILHPYAVLRLLAENPKNLDVDVVWQYGPLVESGWATEGEFTPGARRTQTYLVATEGSSDAHILKHALALLKPEIADFFRFIDVSERHPFPGTGNLLKFAEGLAKIDVHNRVVFLFDNDAEGFDAYLRLLKLALPPNMKAITLPELEQFRVFPAQGPEGVNAADINRRAAAIECYLDLRLDDYPAAKVVWTNYKKDIESYQGALEFKESYAKAFLAQTPETLAAGRYDVSKIAVALQALLAECSTMAAEIRNSAE